MNRLIPILDHISKLKIEVDLQDVLKWFTFNNTCLIVLALIQFPFLLNSQNGSVKMLFKR